jgi:hypothetical protein
MMTFITRKNNEAVSLIEGLHPRRQRDIWNWFHLYKEEGYREDVAVWKAIQHVTGK